MNSCAHSQTPTVSHWRDLGAARLGVYRHSRPRRFSKFPFILLACLGLLASGPLVHAEDSPTLLTMIARWQYPDSQMHGATMRDAATTNALGDRTLQSVQYKVVLTTKDPLTKVIAYYEAKLPSIVNVRSSKVGTKPAADPGQSITVHEDSQGRPLTLHIICVNTDKAATTLVISRAENEPETHIAWTHYVKL